jgi:hypothetical protein
VTETQEVIRTLHDMAARCAPLAPLDCWQLFDEAPVVGARVGDVE